MLAPPPVPPERPAIERVVVLLAYEGYAVEADAVLYGVCNGALWGDDDLHAAVLFVHHGECKRTRLMAAARAGDVPRLTRLLRTASGALRVRSNVNGSASNGSTALHWAAQEGQTAAIEVLLSAGAAVGAANNQGWTPLHYAAQSGQIAAIEALLAAGAAIEATTSRGDIPLHLAADKGHVLAVQALLAAGAATAAKTTVVGATPLHCAAINGHVLAVQALLAAGAAVGAADNGGLNPLHLAAGNGHVLAVQALR